MCIFEKISQIYTLKKRALRPIELLLPLFTSRALPVYRQLFEGHAVVFGGMLGFGKASLGLGRFDIITIS